MGAPVQPARGSVVLITGAMASGKSTVAELLARALPRSVHLRGDAFRTMIVNGRAEMTAEPSPEALRQLRLRYRLSATAADMYAAAGFTVVLQDVVLGAELTGFLEQLRTPERYVVVLAPSVTVLRAREAGRSKTGYHSVDPAALDHVLRHETPVIGLWLDNCDQAPEQTVAEIRSRLSEARV